MIRYSLVCGEGHEFEGWFGSAADFDEQRNSGLLACPNCGETDVAKALMAPNVQKSDARQRKAETPVAPDTTHVAPHSEELRMAVEKIRELRTAVIANTEDVGERFSEEARKIHYGEAKARGIRGQANLQDAAGLVDEGIEIMPMPVLPEDKN